MESRRFRRAVLGAFIALVALPASAEQICVTHWGNLMYGVPYAVAQDKGYFKEAGVAIDGILTSAGGGTTVRNVLAGNLIFGAIDNSNPANVTFDATATPNGMDKQFAVRAQAIVPVQTFGFRSFLGNLTQYNVRAKATAEFVNGKPKLVRVDSVICP